MFTASKAYAVYKTNSKSDFTESVKNLLNTGMCYAKWYCVFDVPKDHIQVDDKYFSK